MDLGNDYWNALDRKPIEGLGVNVKDIGISMGIGDPWKQIKSAVTAGASHVELGFMGMKKGSVGDVMGVTPEIIGKDKREDIRTLAKINDVTLSTHASANAMGFAGLAEGRFSDQAAEGTIQEVKRAVEFAADTAGGGPVVIHTGEFPRELVTSTGEKFEMYPTEKEKAQVGIVNKRTGEIEASFTKDIKIPKVLRDERTGKLIVDAKSGAYKYRQWTFQDYADKAKQTGEDPEKLFYKDYMKMQMDRMSFEQRRWFENTEKARRQFEDLERMKNDIYSQAKKNPEMAKYSAMTKLERMGSVPSPGSKEYQEFLKDPIKFLDKRVEEYKREVKYMEDASTSYGEEFERMREKRDNIMTIKEYGLKQSAKNIAKLGEYAWDVETQRKLKKKMWIAPENVFPETYGSHPRELKELIISSRKAMAERLVKNRGLNEEEARKVSKEHIKATFDIGHANTWRKYFKAKPRESIAETDRRFKKWLINEVKELNRKGIIGHIHLADNFGYHDEHLTPGQGNAPIEEFIKEMKKSGFKEPMVVEPGAQAEGETIYAAMTGTWARVAASPTYRIDGRTQNWTDIEGSYFGRTASPVGIVGKYVPSQDWTFWSETPIE